MPRLCERFKVRNLVSNQAGVAPHQDPLLVNPWGLVINDGTLWVADNESGVLTHYDFSGNKLLPTSVALKLADNSNASPTGLVKNRTNGFLTSGVPAFLLVATEDGVVFAYTPSVNPNGIIVIDNSGLASPPIYKGIEIADNKLYLTDFHNGKVDVYNSSFTKISASFNDPTLPAGYAPFNIVRIGHKLYVSYAKQDADKEDDVAGPGFGFVNVFRFDGSFVKRFVSQGQLNAPWAILEGPEEWCLCGDILIGNFGDGVINVYSKCGEFKGALKNQCGENISIEGLWDLKFACGKLFFTAGPDDEENGLLGFIKKL